MFNHFKRHRIFWAYTVITLAAITAGIYLRLYPLITNPLRQNRAITRLALYVTLRKNILKRINEAPAAISAEQKEKLAQLQLKLILKRSKRSLEKLIAAHTKNQKNQLFRFYLLGADPYYYLYLTQHLVENGTISKAPIKNGEYFDPLMLAPVGTWRKIEAQPYIGYTLYRFLSLFNATTDVTTAVALMPLVFFVICVPLFIMLCRDLRIGMLTTCIASIFFSLSPVFIQRSSFGWYDTDPYNILFLLLALLIFLRLLRDEKNWLLAAALGATSGLYGIFWEGWLFLPAFILTVFFVLCIFRFAEEKRFPGVCIRNTAIFLTSFIACACITLTPQGFIRSIASTLGIFSGFLQFQKNLWPDIFLTVDELKTPTLLKTIYSLGGYAFCTGSAIGLIILMFSRYKKIHRHESILLVALYLWCLLMARNAERFVLLLLVPASVAFAIGLDTIRAFVYRLQLRQGNHHPFIMQAPFVLLLLVPAVLGHITALNQNQRYNYVWDEALKQIKNTTSPESIINSWWPPGHFIKATSQRAVTFDGATMNTPQAYWMARALLATDEAEALGILHMLNTSANRATDFLVATGMPLAEATELILKIVKQDKNAALQTASSHLTSNNAQQLIKLTHGTPKPGYCLIYNDLAENVLGLWYVKNWDFTQAQKLSLDRWDALKKGAVFWRGSRENIKRVWSVAGGPTYIGEETFETDRRGNEISFSGGVTLDIERMQARIENTSQKISGVPYSIIYVEQNKLTEKRLPNATLRLSVLAIRHANNIYSTVIAVPSILKSLIFRLFYLDGVGLSHFKKTILKEDPRLNTKIVVYQFD